jgi:hypothetical protein
MTEAKVSRSGRSGGYELKRLESNRRAAMVSHTAGLLRLQQTGIHFLHLDNPP